MLPNQRSNTFEKRNYRYRSLCGYESIPLLLSSCARFTLIQELTILIIILWKFFPVAMCSASQGDYTTDCSFLSRNYLWLNVSLASYWIWINIINISPYFFIFVFLILKFCSLNIKELSFQFQIPMFCTDPFLQLSLLKFRHHFFDKLLLNHYLVVNLFIIFLTFILFLWFTCFSLYIFNYHYTSCCEFWATYVLSTISFLSKDLFRHLTHFQIHYFIRIFTWCELFTSTSESWSLLTDIVYPFWGTVLSEIWWMYT